jgi:hypothetical protein
MKRLIEYEEEFRFLEEFEEEKLYVMRNSFNRLRIVKPCFYKKCTVCKKEYKVATKGSLLRGLHEAGACTEKCGQSLLRGRENPSLGFPWSSCNSQYKLTTVKVMPFERVVGAKVEYLGVVGTLMDYSLAVPNFELNSSVGVYWHQGQKNLPHFWRDLNDLKLELKAL